MIRAAHWLIRQALNNLSGKVFLYLIVVNKKVVIKMSQFLDTMQGTVTAE